MVYEFRFPDVGEGLTEGTIIKWRVKEGDMVKEDDILADVETAKAVVEIPSPTSGKVLKLCVDEGSIIGVGAVMVQIAGADAEVSAVAHKKIESDEIPLKGIRKEIARNISESYRRIPHVTMMFEADVTRLSILRKKDKVTYLPYIVKAVLEGLKQYPMLNSSFDDEKQAIVMKKEFNISIAVDTEEGVVAPVLRDAEKKDVQELALEMKTLAEKARSRKLSVDELQGGTFTITNVGSVGGVQSTPIINYPQAAILAMHRIKKVPVVIDDNIEIREMLPLAISFDHRIADGGLAARFMKVLICYLEG